MILDKGDSFLKKNQKGEEELLKPGDRVAHFQVKRLLGKGGMGQVFLARDLQLARFVALKLLRFQQKGTTQLASIIKEARITARFSHPNIVSIYQVGEFQGRPFLALEYLDGETLAARLLSPISESEALHIAQEIASALREAHQHKIFHCDLKPGNIIIPSDGRLRILDFGLAIAQRSCSRGGTRSYMAPEQKRHEELSGAVDIWAFGLVFCELLAQERPQFDRQGKPTLPSKLGPEAAQLILSCLRIEAVARPTASELMLRLKMLKRHQVIDQGEEPFRGLMPFSEKHTEHFFGREPEIANLLERLRCEAMILLLGPSGSGKSSLIQAGVLPRLRERDWRIITLRPGRAPFESLAQSLDESELAQPLRMQPEQLNLILSEKAGERPLLLFVDQLEELYTHCEDLEERQAFLQALSSTIYDPEADLHLLLSLRDDFFVRFSAGESFQEELGYIKVLQSLNPEALKQVVLAPLKQNRYRLDDPKLLEEMLDEAKEGVSPLPLLQFTCARLWERRDQKLRCLRYQNYREIGGLAGALADYAEGFLSTFSPQHLQLSRQIFLRLVSPEGTRRILSPSELLSSLDPEAAFVLEKLTASRLLSSRREAQQNSVELSHETLIKSWRRLRSWLEESDTDRQALNRVETAALQWEREGSQKEDLWLRERLEWVKEPLAKMEPSTRAQRFLCAGQKETRRQKIRHLFFSTLSFIALVLVIVQISYQLNKQAYTERLAIAQIGRFHVRLEPYDWNLNEGVTASRLKEFPGLDWTLYEPKKGAELEPDLDQPLRISQEEGFIEARGGLAFFVVEGRGRKGRSCAPSYIPFDLPKYKSRVQEQIQIIKLSVPSCAASEEGLIKIPGGPFQKGDPGIESNPLRIVEVAEFKIDRVELSHSAFRPWQDLRDLKFFYPQGQEFMAGSKYPVVQINAYEAAAFCRYLGKRLPSHMGVTLSHLA